MHVICQKQVKAFHLNVSLQFYSQFFVSRVIEMSKRRQPALERLCVLRARSRNCFDELSLKKREEKEMESGTYITVGTEITNIHRWGGWIEVSLFDYGNHVDDLREFFNENSSLGNVGALSNGPWGNIIVLDASLGTTTSSWFVSSSWDDSSSISFPISELEVVDFLCCIFSYYG
ncbi:hypothetical protein VNO80_30685 [Phaseolus coccineus]|uniref:Uncharacterized protein n=1 Tax=Phaseolus coccineus TaxID=3886 RepID=A0AAN9QG12_PHACN